MYCRGKRTHPYAGNYWKISFKHSTGPSFLMQQAESDIENIKHTLLFHDVLLRNKLILPLETIISESATPFSSKWIDRSFWKIKS